MLINKALHIVTDATVWGETWQDGDFGAAMQPVAARAAPQTDARIVISVENWVSARSGAARQRCKSEQLTVWASGQMRRGHRQVSGPIQVRRPLL
eukprot:COSAG01_NODE_441_length_17032_cov_27.546389_12_plen_95_part_00